MVEETHLLSYIIVRNLSSLHPPQVKFHILLLLLLSGCAVHNPMSEMVMFQKKVEDNGEVTYAGYGHAIAGYSADNYPQQGVNTYLKQRYESTNQFNVAKPASLTTNAIFMNPSYPNVALSVALGPSFGVDMTVKVTHSLFATGSIGWNDYAPANAQFILQKRLLDGNPTGISIGAILVRNHVGYRVIEADPGEGASGGGGISPDNYIETTSVGVRGLLLLRHYPGYETKNRIFLYANAAYMYDTTMKLWYPKLGFSFGFY
jgi:hypothetical protein